MRSTTGKYFLDTNFLVYLFSKDEPSKKKKCANILEDLSGKGNFVISTQVLQEFSAVMIHKYNMNPIEVKSILDDLCEFETIQINPALIKEAIDIQILNRLSFWDSLIISAAESAKCSANFTEDMNHGQEVNGVKIGNPFAS